MIHRFRGNLVGANVGDRPTVVAGGAESGATQPQHFGAVQRVRDGALGPRRRAAYNLLFGDWRAVAQGIT
jgi:hypothetical protein